MLRGFEKIEIRLIGILQHWFSGAYFFRLRSIIGLLDCRRKDLSLGVEINNGVLYFRRRVSNFNQSMQASTVFSLLIG